MLIFMAKKIVFVFLCILYFENLYSQDFKKIFLEINSKDKFFIITKPITSLIVIKIAMQVNSILVNKQSENFLDSDPQGGQIDAFRHIFLMYKLSLEIGIEKARRIGNIYESYNEKVFYKNPDSGYDEVGQEMDKFNNEVGIYLFLKLGIVDDKTLINEIEKEIIKGTARKIYKNNEKRSISIDNMIIEDSIWMKSWKNERVLIQSNR